MGIPLLMTGATMSVGCEMLDGSDAQQLITEDRVDDDGHELDSQGDSGDDLSSKRR